jgi:hypothetical protein
MASIYWIFVGIMSGEQLVISGITEINLVFGPAFLSPLHSWSGVEDVGIVRTSNSRILVKWNALS